MLRGFKIFIWIGVTVLAALLLIAALGTDADKDHRS